MNIGSKMLQFRTDEGWSQEYIAHRMGITQGAYSKFETNHHPPSLPQLEPLCIIFGKESSDFLKTEAGPMQINNNQSGGSAANYMTNPVQLLEAAHRETIQAKNETIQAKAETIQVQKEAM